MEDKNRIISATNIIDMARAKIEELQDMEASYTVIKTFSEMIIKEGKSTDAIIVSTWMEAILREANNLASRNQLSPEIARIARAVETATSVEAIITVLKEELPKLDKIIKSLEEELSRKEAQADDAFYNGEGSNKIY